LALSETFISTILATSVTTAGLILAIYALLTPIFGRIVETRRTLLADKKAEFDKQQEMFFNSNIISSNKIRKLQVLKSEIDEVRTFPPFFGDFVLLSFLFCTISFLVAMLIFSVQIINPTDNAVNAEAILMVSLFVSGCYLFFGVGAYAIVQISRILRKEWETLIEEKEEAEESTSEELEKLKKDIEELKEKEDRRVSG
jgi:hypothetical protein